MKRTAPNVRVTVVLVANVIVLVSLAAGILSGFEAFTTPLSLVALVAIAAAIMVLTYLARHGMVVTVMPGRVLVRQAAPDPTDMNRVDPATGKTLARLEAERRYDTRTAPSSASSKQVLDRALAERGLHWKVSASDQPLVCPSCENVNPARASRCGRCGQTLGRT